MRCAYSEVIFSHSFWEVIRHPRLRVNLSPTPIHQSARHLDHHSPSTTLSLPLHRSLRPLALLSNSVPLASHRSVPSSWPGPGSGHRRRRSRQKWGGPDWTQSSSTGRLASSVLTRSVGSASVDGRGPTRPGSPTSPRLSPSSGPFPGRIGLSHYAAYAGLRSLFAPARETSRPRPATCNKSTPISTRSTPGTCCSSDEVSFLAFLGATILLPIASKTSSSSSGFLSMR